MSLRQRPSAGVRVVERPPPLERPGLAKFLFASEPKRDPGGRAHHVIEVVMPIGNRQPAEVGPEGDAPADRNDHATPDIERTIRRDAARYPKDPRDVLFLDRNPSRAESDEPKGAPAGVP